MASDYHSWCQDVYLCQYDNEVGITISRQHELLSLCYPVFAATACFLCAVSGISQWGAEAPDDNKVITTNLNEGDRSDRSSTKLYRTVLPTGASNVCPDTFFVCLLDVPVQVPVCM